VVELLRQIRPAERSLECAILVRKNDDGTATLSYKTPSHVFAPYIDEAGPELAEAARELDEIFAAVAAAATR